MKKLAIALAITAVSGASQLLAADITWQKDIKPMFDKQCAACHGATAPEHDEFGKNKKMWTEKGIGMRMDTYGHFISYVGWPYTGAMMRRLDDGTNLPSKKPGNMYEYLGKDDAERKANLALVKAWIGNWNTKRFKDVTKEELGLLKLKY
jgi:hypothetical protein